jgi:DNA-directed RNA polymerase subunit beta
LASSSATISPAAISANPSFPGAPTRVTFAKIREPLEVPDLLDL